MDHRNTAQKLTHRFLVGGRDIARSGNKAKDVYVYHACTEDTEMTVWEWLRKQDGIDHKTIVTRPWNHPNRIIHIFPVDDNHPAVRR